MGLQFHNINTQTSIKHVSRVNNTNKVTSLKKKKYSKRKLYVKHSLTADNLVFLRSLNAI